MDGKLILDTRDGAAPGHRVMKLEGPLVLSNLFEFQPAVRGETAALLVLDMGGVPYIDSAGIGALVNTHISCQRAGRKLSLVGVNKRSRDVLVITQVEKLFQFYETVEQAERAAQDGSAESSVAR
jgi:anti-sigma B factor antagonist